MSSLSPSPSLFIHQAYIPRSPVQKHLFQAPASWLRISFPEIDYGNSFFYGPLEKKFLWSSRFVGVTTLSPGEIEGNNLTSDPAAAAAAFLLLCSKHLKTSPFSFAVLFSWSHLSFS